MPAGLLRLAAALPRRHPPNVAACAGGLPPRLLRAYTGDLDEVTLVDAFAATTAWTRPHSPLDDLDEVTLADAFAAHKLFVIM